MTTRFSIKSLLASNAHVDLDDSLNTKEALRRLGYYKTPGYGMTPYPDSRLFEAVSDLQLDQGIRRTGEIRPGDDTEKAIRHALRDQSSKISDGREKKGQYIWRTRGDGKVRSEHADRDGKVFDWDNPPEGGHPGEAHNCRCWAEPLNCISQELKRDEIRKEHLSMDGELSAIRPKVNNARIDVERHRADIDFYLHVNQTAKYGGMLTRAPHPLGRFAGWVFTVGERISASVLSEIEAELKQSEIELKRLEEQSRKISSKWQNLKTAWEDAGAALERCRNGNQ